MDNDDARNVDDQLDEQQRSIEEQRKRPLIENHTNNARVETPAVDEPGPAP